MPNTWRLIAVTGEWHIDGIGRLDLYHDGHETVILIGDREGSALHTQDTRFLADV